MALAAYPSGGGSAGANVGGSGAPANGSANASIGADSANATASIGSSGVAPAVGGTNGVANVTLGTDNATAAVGTGTGTGLGVGATPSTIGTPSNPNPPGISANISSGQLARMKKRCVDVINNEGTYDNDLRQLCLQVARR